MLVKLRLEQLEFDREKPELERPHRNQLAEVPPPAPSLLFWTGAPPRRARWGAISVSVFVHALVIWTSVAYLHYVAGLPPDPVEAILHARVLEITTHRAFQFHISDDATKGAAEELAKSSSARAAAGKGKPDLEAAERAAEQPLPKDGAPRARFRMPPQATAKPVPQTLAQLDLPPTLDMRPDLRVPELVLLSNVTRFHVVKPFVAPPPRPKPAEVPNQVVLELRPPIVDLQAQGYAKSPDLLVHTTILPPVGAKSPVTSDNARTENDPGLTVRGDTASESPDIISLPPHPVPLSASIVLPPLNQVAAKDAGLGGERTGQGADGRPGPSQIAGTVGSAGSTDGSSNKGAAGTGAGSHGSEAGAGKAKAGRGEGAGGEVASATGKGAGHDAAGGGHEATGGHGAGAGRESGAGGAGHEAGSGSGKGGSGGSTTKILEDGPYTKIVRPRTGQYEIAVVQSSAPIPGSTGLLKGQPVYSVYIPVGTSKEWILQYCLPNSEAKAEASSQVVELGAMTPVSAPYAFTLARPKIEFRPGARYGFIHGYVNASGRLEQVAEVGEPVLQEVATVLKALGEWEFRPALKDGVATAVEVLLCIPST